MKVSIAAFESTESGCICFFAFAPKDKEWVKITEFTDVELVDVPNAKILKLEDEIKALEKKRDELLGIAYEADAKADALTEDF